MADFQVIGYINTIKYLPDACILFVDEYKNGYTKKNGEKVQDAYWSWRCIFKAYFKDFVNKHFSRGMLVQVKGEIKPFTLVNDDIQDGYSVIGQTINLYSYPRYGTKLEKKNIKESELHSIGTPNIEEYMKDDF